MEFNELTEIWNRQDQQLDSNLQLNQEMFLELSNQRIRRNLGELRFELIFEVVASVFFFSFLLRYLVHNFGELKFFLPGLFLALVVVFGSAFAIYRLILASRVDVRTSVVRTQKSIHLLRYYEKLDTNSLLVLIPLFAVAFVVVAARGWFGVDLYSILGDALWWFGASSAVIGGIIWFLLRRYPSKKLREAQEFLAEIKELEK